MQVNNQLADFGIDKKGNTSKLTQARITRHMPAEGYDGPSNQIYDAQSMNSEAFSQFSLPTHMNGLKVNVGQNSNIIQSQARAYDRNINMMQESQLDSSSQFSSAVRSNRTINQQMVNLGAPSAAPGMMCQSNYEQQNASSYYQTEESFQSAEQNAFDHEQQAKMRRQEKELKLQEFQNKTKQQASIRAKKEKLAKVSEADQKKAAALEKQLKVKEYAKKQKELLQKKNSRRQDATANSNSDLGKSNSHQEIVNSIVNIENRNIENNSQSYMMPQSMQQNISYEPIAEVSEENVSQTQQSSQKGQRQMTMAEEYQLKQSQRQKQMPSGPGRSAQNSALFSQNAQAQVNNFMTPQQQQAQQQQQQQFQQYQQILEEKKQQELGPLTDMMKTYSQIDQGQLEKMGFDHKSEFTNESGGLKAIHRYSALQRFRSGKAFNAVDKFKPADKELQEQLKLKEEQFWRTNVQSEQQKKEEEQQRTERSRYLNALKALVKEKGDKFGGDNTQIPPLCSCGAQVENIKSVKGGQGKATALCASNCQFYKNEKGYVKALRDVLHSMQQLQQK